MSASSRHARQHDIEGRFRIDGVTGPDEYSAVADNNVFTNLMAEQNLRAAADLVTRHHADAEALGVTPEEAASWRDAAAAVVIPFDARLEVHPQAEGFTDHARWDFAATKPSQYPLMLHFPYFDLYRKQVVKQADLVLAMHLRGDAFTPEQKARNFAYYEPITVRDSSLSAATQAVIAAEVGLIELAHDYLDEAALVDLRDVAHNTRDGLHMASLAGTWTALVAGFGGFRACAGRISFLPRLSSRISKISFRLRYRGRRLLITLDRADATYELLEGDPIMLVHDGTEFELSKEAVIHPMPAVSSPPSVQQPPGRKPARAHPSARD